MDKNNYDANVTKAKDIFNRHFNVPDSGDTNHLVVSIAPGRVNLIGEHIDYNDGCVLPLAINLTTVVVCQKSENNLVRIMSDQDVNDATLKLRCHTFSTVKEELKPGEKNWIKYVQGVIAQYSKDIDQIGFDAVVVSTVPLGGGLSSSASLEVAIASAIETLYKLSDITGMDKALRCVHAEHEYAKVPCGVMDQIAVSLAKKNCVLALDCRSRNTENIPFLSDDYSLVVCNSNATHELSGGEYAERVDSCKRGLSILNALGNTSFLSLREFKESGNLNLIDDIEEELIKRRTKHVVDEMCRVSEFIYLLKSINSNNHADSIRRLGDLMYSSHESLSTKFEVSTPELDKLVEFAKKIEGVVGSRMTGGGFGGCTISIVQSVHLVSFKEQLRKQYLDFCNKECIIYVTKPEDGAQAFDAQA